MEAKTAKRGLPNVAASLCIMSDDVSTCSSFVGSDIWLAELAMDGDAIVAVSRMASYHCLDHLLTVTTRSVLVSQHDDNLGQYVSGAACAAC